MAHTSSSQLVEVLNATTVVSSAPSGTKRSRSLDEEHAYSPLTKRSKAASSSSTRSIRNGVVSHSKDVEYEEYVINNISSLSNDETLSDVVFIVEGEELKGILSLFAAQSMVFKRMLFGSMMESNPSNEVILSDITVEAFKYLRSTFYNVFDRESADSVLTPRIVVDVLFAAQKYLIDPLIAKCLSFIKNVQSVADWYLILRDFEASPFQIQSKLYLEQILNPQRLEDAAYILQFESVQFVESEHFEKLRAETVLIVIRSDFLAVKEDQIWESLLKWTRFNAHKMRAETAGGVDGDSENEADREDKDVDDAKDAADNDTEQKEADKEREQSNVDDGGSATNCKSTLSPPINLSATERAMMTEFSRFVRFNQMDAAYFREHIVDQQLLPHRDVIDIMFSRENGSKWTTKYNDTPRHKTKRMDTFRLSDIALSLKEVAALSVGDTVDFRDLYGLFCSATVREVDHNEHRVKIHYINWGSTYDEWFAYKAGTEQAARSRHRVVLKQQDLLHRIVRHGAVTGRSCLREPFNEKVKEFKKMGFRRADAADSTEKVQVKLPMAFWKKNEHFIEDKEQYIGQWLSAKIIGFKTAVKYSEHIKVGLYINGDHYEYWVHPDNADEVRVIPNGRLVMMNAR